ncbi:MAG: M24 family metallopeptidase, partial [Lachnospiraceae bacterium]|nr:M24 family metallopeptidase [Lachnospiraceae bacterium]
GGQYEFKGTTDITRTIALGEVTDEEKKVYTTVLIGNLRLMDMTFPSGYRGALLDLAAESPLWEGGYYCGHGIGHGVGCYLSVHESDVRIGRSSEEWEAPIVPGIIVSDEPGIYLEGKFGVRLENLLLCVRAEDIDGVRMCRFEPLSLVPFDKDAIDMSLLTGHERDILSRYNDLIWEKISPLLNEDERNWLKEIIDIN